MKEKRNKTAIVILNWNSINDTVSCIQTIFRTQEESFDIIVVDNGSDNDTLRIINEQYPDIVIIENAKNLGFGGGMNVGLRYCYDKGYPTVLLLNNDTLFLQSGIITAYHSVLGKYPQIGALTAKVALDLNGEKLQREPITDTSTLSKILYKTFYPPYKMPVVTKSKQMNGYSLSFVPNIHGVAIGFRTEILDEIGYLNSDFFCYEEDRDFFIRIRDAGYELAVLNDYWIYHKWSGSTSRMSPFKMYYKSRNLWYMKNRYHSKRYILYAYLRLLGVAFKNHLVSYYLQGLRDGIKGITGDSFIIEKEE